MDKRDRTKVGGVALVVLWNGEVLINLGALEDNMRLMHMANFVVVHQHDGLVIWKERYQHGLQGTVIDHRQMFEHAVRHVHATEEAGCYGSMRRLGPPKRREDIEQ